MKTAPGSPTQATCICGHSQADHRSWGCVKLKGIVTACPCRTFVDHAAKLDAIALAALSAVQQETT